MHKPDVSGNEPSRIDSLHALGILDTAPEERFDRLTRLAKRLFNVPIALVSLVDVNRQWFKSCIGLQVRETPREISFCGHAILQDEIFEIPDTLEDIRFVNNPLVTGDPHIRFYAGCPIKVYNGSRLGTLCIIDRVPRQLSEEDKVSLRDLASIVEHEIAASQIATLDELTMLLNRRGFEALGEHAVSVCKRINKPISLLYFDLNNFKKVNDAYGHAEGDGALIQFAEILKSKFRDSDVIARLGGDEFVVLLTDADFNSTSKAIATLQNKVDEYNLQAKRGYDLQFSFGQIEYDPNRHNSLAALVADADAAMYRRKHATKN